MIVKGNRMIAKEKTTILKERTKKASSLLASIEEVDNKVKLLEESYPEDVLLSCTLSITRKSTNPNSKSVDSKSIKIPTTSVSHKVMDILIGSFKLESNTFQQQLEEIFSETND